MKSPLLLIFVGTNGAGKSTMYERLIPVALQDQIVNPDRIALQLAQNKEYQCINDLPENLKESINLQAGKIALKRRLELLSLHKDLIVETTGSSPSLLRLISKAQSLGYLVRLECVTLGLSQLHLRRIATRVAAQGHYIEDKVVLRRYERTWELLPQAIALADYAELFDNSNQLSKIMVKDATGYKVNTQALALLPQVAQQRLKALLSQLSVNCDQDHTV